MAKRCDSCKKKKKRCRCKTGGVRQHVTVKIDQSRRGVGKAGMPLIIPSGGGGGSPSVINLSVPPPNFHDMVNPSLPPIHQTHMSRMPSSSSNDSMREAPSVHVNVPRVNVIYDEFDVHVPRARVVDSPVDISVPRFNTIDIPYNVPNPVATQVDIPVQVPNFVRRETDIPIQTPNWVRNPIDIPIDVPNVRPIRATRGIQPSVPAIGDAHADEHGRNVARRRNRDDTPRIGTVPASLLGNANPVYIRGVPRWLVDMPEVNQALEAGMPNVALYERHRALRRFVAGQPEYQARNLAGVSETDRREYQMQYANRVIRAFFTQMGRTQLEAPPPTPPPALPAAATGQVVAHRAAGPIEEIRGLV